MTECWGWTGPCLRASGVDRDLSKDDPYYNYDDYQWDTADMITTGDTYDRMVVRMFEMLESTHHSPSPQ